MYGSVCIYGGWAGAHARTDSTQAGRPARKTHPGCGPSGELTIASPTVVI